MPARHRLAVAAPVEGRAVHRRGLRVVAVAPGVRAFCCYPFCSAQRSGAGIYAEEKIMIRKILCASVLLFPVAVWAGDNAPTAAVELFAEPVALKSLLKRVESKSDRRFLVAADVPKQLKVGHLRIDNVDYPLLLSLLRSNGLAAVSVQGVTNIVSEGNVRSYPIPTVTESDDYADDEWVTKLIYLRNLKAPGSSPSLRPLMPRAGHLAAVSDLNAVLIVDRYANVNRLEGLLEDLDRAAGADAVARSD